MAVVVPSGVWWFGGGQVPRQTVASVFSSDESVPVPVPVAVWCVPSQAKASLAVWLERSSWLCKQRVWLAARCVCVEQLGSVQRQWGTTQHSQGTQTWCSLGGKVKEADSVRRRLPCQQGRWGNTTTRRTLQKKPSYSDLCVSKAVVSRSTPRHNLKLSRVLFLGLSSEKIE